MSRLTILSTATSSAAPTAVTEGVALRVSDAHPGRLGEGFHDNIDTWVLSLWNDAGTGTISLSYARLWVWHPAAARWFPLGNGADTTKGYVNDGTALGESAANQVLHTEVLRGLGAFTRVAVELGTVGGTAVTWCCDLISVRQ